VVVGGDDVVAEGALVNDDATAIAYEHRLHAERFAS